MFSRSLLFLLSFLESEDLIMAIRFDVSVVVKNFCGQITICARHKAVFPLGWIGVKCGRIEIQTGWSTMNIIKITLA